MRALCTIPPPPNPSQDLPTHARPAVARQRCSPPRLSARKPSRWSGEKRRKKELWMRKQPMVTNALSAHHPTPQSRSWATPTHIARLATGHRGHLGHPGCLRFCLVERQLSDPAAQAEHPSALCTSISLRPGCVEVVSCSISEDVPALVPPSQRLPAHLVHKRSRTVRFPDETFQDARS